MVDLETQFKEDGIQACSIEGCERPAKTKGMCTMHYNRARLGIINMSPEPIRKRPPWKPDDIRYGSANRNKTCSVPGCPDHVYAKGLCRRHYALKANNGKPDYKKNLVKPKKCKVTGCDETAGRLGYCSFHLQRKRAGTKLTRPKGIKRELNPNWKGGVFDYPDHYTMKINRLIALKNANWKCVYCGKEAKVVHHKDGSKRNHSVSNLLPCCHKCHFRFGHRKLSKTSKFIREYGATLKVLADRMGRSTHTIKKWHMLGILKERLVYSDELMNVLF
jgi:hypothetical protein